jgi:aminoglycoside N3'-acetyltransferase
LLSGQVLFLGVTLDSNTAFHCIEALADLRYLLNTEPENFTIVDGHGHSREIAVRRHRADIPRRFRPWKEPLLASGILKAGKVGCAQSLLLDGKPFRDFMLDAVSKDPVTLLVSGQNYEQNAPSRWRKGS